MCVVFTQQKNGFSALCWRVMKSFAAATNSSSHVSIRLRVKGPVSSIFCLPTRPQRGCSVGSSLSGRPATQHAARTVGRFELRELLRIRIVRILGIFLGVEVIEVAEEFIEAVDCRQVLVQVAEVVLAELTGRVTLRLQQLGDRRVFCLEAHIHARRADFRKTGTEYALSGDECRATRGAALFAIGIGEQHPFPGDAIDVGSLVPHHAAAVA